METETFRIKVDDNELFGRRTMQEAISSCRMRAIYNNHLTKLFAFGRNGWVLLGTYYPDPNGFRIWLGETIPVCVSEPVISTL